MNAAKTVQTPAHAPKILREGSPVLRGRTLTDAIRPTLEALPPEVQGSAVGGREIARAMRVAKRAWVQRAQGDKRMDELCDRIARNDRALRALNAAGVGGGVGRGGIEPWVEGGLRTSGAAVGLNHLLFESGVGKFGTTSEQLDDLASLSAGFARHVGEVDVTWKALTGRTETPIPATYAEILAAVFGAGDANLSKLRTFFADARSRGVKVVLTTPMHAGGPGDNRLDARGTMGRGWASGLMADFSAFIFDDGDFPRWFDPYNFDKLLRVAWICEAVGELLTAAGAASDVVLGIEGFNEVTSRNVYDGDPIASGWAWGRVHAQCARALRMTAPADIPISLPSLASYVLEAPATDRIDTWEQMVDFLDAMAAAVVYDCARHGDDPASFASGVDYHWYLARQTGTEAGLVRRPVAYMLSEVETLRDVLNSHAGLERAEVRVMETGASAHIGEADQAYEVWRRLGGALAAGVDRAAWHTWMSTEEVNADGNFAMFGLREDLTVQSAEGDDDDDAIAAVPRPSWAAFWQLAQVLNVRRGRKLRLTHGPSLFPGESLVPAGLLALAPLAVFEYLLVGGDYAYLVLVDPSYARASFLVSAVGGSFAEYETVPVVTSSPTGGLPTAVVASTISTHIVSVSFTISLGDPPRLFVTPRRVSWSVEVT